MTITISRYVAQGLCDTGGKRGLYGSKIGGVLESDVSGGNGDSVCDGTVGVTKDDDSPRSGTVNVTSLQPLDMTSV